MLRKILIVAAIAAVLLTVACSGESKPEPASETVYITNTGKRYHRASCESLSKSKIPISKKDAIAKGYTPCQRCNP